MRPSRNRTKLNVLSKRDSLESKSSSLELSREDFDQFKTMGRIESDSRDERRNEALRLFDEFMIDPPTANIVSDVFNRKDI